MSNSAATPPQASAHNVPNYVTAARLVLSLVVFALIAWAQTRAETKDESAHWIYGAAMLVFILAAATDWVDGYWARKYGQVTQVGRIFDPFVDKVIVCGTFIFLVASPGSEVKGWMTVVIVGRELLVTALRSQVEGMGMDFSAKWAGKIKMVVQCAAAATSLGVLWLYPANGAPPALRATLIVLLWGTVAITVYSGAGYVAAAARMLRR
jgi:CDP-diacylglycerol--glycerol-3-phosphate 3-phosphatidyltransferase